MVAGVTSSNITVVWGEVPCADQNGDITGYSVQYGVMGSGSTQTMAVDGDSSGGMATISELEAATMYVYQVAGRTTVGPGDYSSPMTTLTSGTTIYSSAYTVCIHFSSFSESSKCDGVLSKSILNLHLLDQLWSSGGEI